METVNPIHRTRCLTMLSKVDIEWLEAEFGGPVNWIDGALNGLPASWQGWAHVVISPLPSPKELKPVAEDICNDEYIRIEGGRLKHSNLCTSKTHYITGVTNPSRIGQCLHTISDTAYNVAIYSNINDGQSECLYLGQPLVVVFSPAIDYIRYPGHLHLNTGAIVRETGHYMPDTLCYRKSFEELLALPLRERLLETLFEVSMWLYRHQIWVASGEWIGEHEPTLGPETFHHHLNPAGYCRCGSGKKYRACCMPRDTIVGASMFPKIDYRSNPETLLRLCSTSWDERVGKPQLRALELLKNNFNVKD